MIRVAIIDPATGQIVQMMVSADIDAILAAVPAGLEAVTAPDGVDDGTYFLNPKTRRYNKFPKRPAGKKWDWTTRAWVAA